LIVGISSENTVQDIAESDFDSVVLASTRPVLVAFGTAWSKPCKVLLDTLFNVATQSAGTARVFKVDVDEFPDLGLWYSINSVPTLIWFLNGKIHARIVGTATVSAILAKMPA